MGRINSFIVFRQWHTWGKLNDPVVCPCTPSQQHLVFYNIIGASLSEPHIDEKYMRESYMFVWYVRHPCAALYKTYRPHEILSDDKSAVKKNQLRATWTYVIAIKQASATQQTVVIMLSKEQTVL